MDDIKSTEEALRNNATYSLKLCMKLAELENHWPEVVGKAAAERSAPVSCEYTDEVPVISVHVDSPGVLPTMMSRRSVISRSVSRYLGVKEVRLEIKVGKVRRQTFAKDPLPDHLRRPPVLISEASLQKNIREISAEVKDEELAESLARLKTVIERLSMRKK